MKPKKKRRRKVLSSYWARRAAALVRAGKPDRRRHLNNRRPARFITKENMARRMRARAQTRWKIVGRRANGMLLTFTGTKLAQGGKPVIFPTRALAYQFLRYLRRTFGAHLKSVRLLVLPA